MQTTRLPVQSGLQKLGVALAHAVTFTTSHHISQACGICRGRQPQLGVPSPQVSSQSETSLLSFITTSPPLASSPGHWPLSLTNVLGQFPKNKPEMGNVASVASFEAVPSGGRKQGREDRTQKTGFHLLPGVLGRNCPEWAGLEAPGCLWANGSLASVWVGVGSWAPRGQPTVTATAGTAPSHQQSPWGLDPCSRACTQAPGGQKQAGKTLNRLGEYQALGQVLRDVHLAVGM